MTSLFDRVAALPPEKRAILAEMLRSAPEPIAIVGMGCRFPGGADTPAAYWQLLVSGRDAIREVPQDRWDVAGLYDPDPDAPGKMTSRYGGFLDDVAGFDPHFFGISPREAASMDPQQRLALEVAHEALEDAGIPPDRLAGSRTGVFIGICPNDYAQLQWADPTAMDIYSGTGTANNIVAGRISYLLDLRGPCMVVDTACSSSLVALHLACQSLRNRESDLALAGGVNLILAPLTMIVPSKMGMLAPDGRCKTFDTQADGIAMGEGGGVVVLKR
jgi:acyl transferase domain-containing protein